MKTRIPYRFRELATAIENRSASFKRTSPPAVVFPSDEAKLTRLSVPIILKPQLEAMPEVVAKFQPSIVVAMQAESCGILLIDQLEIKSLRIFKRYTVRKSQGSAQLKHLQTKGKSRLGSRIRLQQLGKLFSESTAELDRLISTAPQTKHVFTCINRRLLAAWLDTARPACWNQTSDRLFPAGLDMPRPSEDSMLQLVYRLCLTSEVSELD